MRLNRILSTEIVTSATETVREFAGTSVILSCVATADNTVDILWRKKAADWTAETPTFDTLTGAQDPYDDGSGTRKSTLTLSSPTATDTSDHIECYDEAIGISGVMALEVIGENDFYISVKHLLLIVLTQPETLTLSVL